MQDLFFKKIRLFTGGHRMSEKRRRVCRPQAASQSRGLFRQSHRVSVRDGDAHPVQVYFPLRWMRLTTTITAPNTTPAMAQMNQLYCACPLPEGLKVYHRKMATTTNQ